MKIDLPKGVRTFNPKESFILSWIEKNIEDNFKLWGYEKVILPLLEYYDAHKNVLNEEILKNTFRLVDRYEGETLILRPDFTVQIARYIASLQEKEFPIRLYYAGDVFRYVVPKGDNLYEKKQIGVELIGVDKIEADAEIIAIAISSLKKLSIENFQIDVNNVKIFKAITRILNLSQDQTKELFLYLKNREIYNIQAFLKDFDVNNKIKDFILNLPKLNIKADKLKELAEEYEDIEEISNALKELIVIYEILKEYQLDEYIVFDLCEPREFSYYTGIVFEIFIKDFPKIVGYGGRYDNLLSNYNGNHPATGFAFDLLAIYDHITKTIEIKNEKDFYIIDTTEDKKLAYNIAKNLRTKGHTVARDIIKRDIDLSIDFAFRNGYKNVILITVENSEKKVYILKDKNKKEETNLEEILK